MILRSPVNPIAAVALPLEMITFESFATMRIPNESPVRFSPERKIIHQNHQGSSDVGCRAADMVPIERNWT
jgi:hypothetical protein